MHKTRFLLIGAGPTSLGAAYRLRELGELDFVILEQHPWCGGLATSFVDRAGFTWDIGGHVQFSHYPYFDAALDDAVGADGWYRHKRAAFVWCEGRFVPYPFQSNIGMLPRDAMWECIKGLLNLGRQSHVGRPNDFHEWIHATFGAGIARVFMLPYNEKVWAYPPREMSYQWIGDRVAPVDLEKVLFDLFFEKEATTWGPNNTFRFPKYGGTGAIWNAMADKIGRTKILTSSPVISVDATNHRVTVESGEQFEFEHLLSTVPVCQLVKMLPECEERIINRAAELRYSSTHVVGLGFAGELPQILAEKSWMYFPGDEFPFYRMTVFSGYSPAHVPDASCQYSLMLEMSSSPYRALKKEDLIERCHSSLIAAGLVPSTHPVLTQWQFSTRFGYPTPSLARDEILREVIPYLDSRGIYSRGRFGGWKYEVSNQDHTFMQGVEWVNKIVNHQPEVTYRALSSEDPNVTVFAPSGISTSPQVRS